MLGYGVEKIELRSHLDTHCKVILCPLSFIRTGLFNLAGFSSYPNLSILSASLFEGRGDQAARSTPAWNHP